MADAAAKPAFDPSQSFQPTEPAPSPAPAQAAGGTKPQFDPNASFQSAPSSDTVAQESHPIQDAALKTLDTAGRVLDYPGGFVRAGLASVAGLATGKGEIVTTDDLKRAAVGKGPSSSEYFERAGIPELGSVDIPLLGKITGRGTAGFITDIATDPLTAIAKLAKEAPYINKILNSAGQGAQALGEAVYKSAFQGKLAPAAEAMLEGVPELGVAGQAPIGGAKTLAQKITDTSGIMGKVRQTLYDKADELGVKVNTGDIDFSKTNALLEKLARNKNYAPLQQEIQGMIDNFASHGEVPISQLSEWKTDLCNTLPKSAWGANGRLMPLGKQLKAAMASDFKDVIVSSGNDAEKGLGDAINTLNDKWGPILNALPDAGKALSSTPSSKLGTMIDGAVLAAGGLKGVAVKKGYDLATSPLAKTAVGAALMSSGQNGIAQGVANRLLINNSGAQDSSSDTVGASLGGSPPQQGATQSNIQVPPPAVVTGGPPTAGSINSGIIRGSQGIKSLQSNLVRPGG